MEFDNMLFAANLRRLLDNNNMKAVDLAQRVGVSNAIVSQWLKGVKIPRMDKVSRICSVLDCSLEDLAGADAPAPELTPAQRELLELVQAMTPEELSVLASTAKALKAARRDPGQK